MSSSAGVKARPANGFTPTFEIVAGDKLSEGGARRYLRKYGGPRSASPPCIAANCANSGVWPRRYSRFVREDGVAIVSAEEISIKMQQTSCRRGPAT